MPPEHVLLFVELEERPKYRCRWANKRLYDCGKNSPLSIFYEKKLKEIREGVSSEKQPRFSNQTFTVRASANQASGSPFVSV